MDNVNTIAELEYGFEGTGEVKDFTFHKEHETKTHYIYSVTDHSLGEDRRYWFEAFERKRVPLCLDFEKRIYSETEYKEIYPKAKDFGVWAKTFNNIKEARRWIEQ